MRLGRRRQRRDAVVGVGKVKRVQEVAHVGATPRQHILGRNRLALGGLPLLNKLDLRRVVCVFGEDATLARPWRNDVKRQAEAGPDKGIPELAVRVLNPLSGSAVGRMVRADVVEPAAGFVVGNDERRIFVFRRVEHRIGHVALQPGAVVRRVRRVLRQLRGANNVRDLGQRPGGQVLVVFWVLLLLTATLFHLL